jgi:membrane protein implicated in regulation of membrane protease activity
MIVAGIVLLLLGFLTGIAILWWLGIILLVIGVVLLALSFRPYAGEGAGPWYHRRWY